MYIFGKELTLQTIATTISAVGTATLVGGVVFLQVNAATEAKQTEELKKAADTVFQSAQKYQSPAFRDKNGEDAATEWNKENKRIKASVETIDGGYTYVKVVGYGDAEIKSDALYEASETVVATKPAAASKSSSKPSSNVPKSGDAERDARRAEFEKKIQEKRGDKPIPEVSAEDIESR